MTLYRYLFILALIVSSLCSFCSADPPTSIEFTKLDDFENVTPWLGGDPNTDLEQKDAAVAADTEFVKEGKQSLAFRVRINWTQRPNEKYAKGWPMMRRQFDAPQDWSRYDYLYFRLYPKTNSTLAQQRVLGIGFPHPDAKSVRTWYYIPGIEPNKWQEIAVPLTLDVDWKQVAGISFYLAEAWYKDGDKIDFIIDDMRLARRTVPGICACTLSSRIFPRGTAVGMHLKIEGPYEGTGVRCRITDTQDGEQFSFLEKMTAKEEDFVFPTKGIPAGGHYGMVDLLDKEGKAVDSRKKYFRSLEPGKRSYLKLITFYSVRVMTDDIEALGVLNDSAYAGVALPIATSYSTDPVPTYESLEPKLKKVREILKIDPWPWVALNRMIGAPPDGSGHAAKNAKDLKYFQAIKGMDLGNETGARDDMLKIWRLAVRAAREWKSPGIMFDPEAYNWYRTDSVDFLAEQRGESVDEVIRKCEALGADFAKIIEKEYPACIVWSLFSRLERSYPIPGREEKVLTMPSYIALGMLNYAKAHNLPLKFLCGGETTPGYCNKSVAALKQRIAQRDDDDAPFLEQFPDRLFLAGTISPFHDYAITTSFIEKGYKDSDFKTIADFEPMFKTLFDAYDYLWIYAASAAKTEPYKPENNRMYGEVLRKALHASGR